MASKPTQRTLAELRKNGYVAGVTEKTIPHCFIKQDFPYDSAGFGDIIAYHEDRNEVLAIQTCADNGGDVARRREKILASENARKWVLQPCRRLQIWGWGKRGERGKRKLWTLRVVDITLMDFAPKKEPASMTLFTSMSDHS